MARRIDGYVDVKRRPDGGAVITLKAATGEAFEIERNADQVATLREKLAEAPSITPSPAEPAETLKSKRRRDTVDVTTSEGETNA